MKSRQRNPTVAPVIMKAIGGNGFKWAKDTIKNIVSNRASIQASIDMKIVSKNKTVAEFINLSRELKERKHEFQDQNPTQLTVLMDIDIDKKRMQPAELLQYYAECEEQKIAPSIQTINGVIEAHLKLGQKKEAFEVIKCMEIKHKISPNLQTFNILLSDCIRNRMGVRMIEEIMSVMQETYELKAPSEIILQVAQYFFKHESSFSIAMGYYERLKQIGLNAEHCEKLLQSAFKNSNGSYNKDLVLFFVKQAEEAKVGFPVNLWQKLGVEAARNNDSHIASMAFTKIFKWDDDDVLVHVLEEFLMFSARNGNVSMFQQCLKTLLNRKSMNSPHHFLSLYITCVLNAKPLDVAMLDKIVKMMKNIDLFTLYPIINFISASHESFQAVFEYCKLNPCSNELISCLLFASKDSACLKALPLLQDNLLISNSILHHLFNCGLYEDALKRLLAMKQKNDDSWFIASKALLQTDKIEYLALVLKYFREIGSPKYFALLKPYLKYSTKDGSMSNLIRKKISDKIEIIE